MTGETICTRKRELPLSDNLLGDHDGPGMNRESQPRLAIKKAQFSTPSWVELGLRGRWCSWREEEKRIGVGEARVP